MLKPKLLFLCKYYPPEVGGIELVSEKLVNFSQCSFSVSTISFKKRTSQSLSTRSFKFFFAFEIFRQPISIQYFIQSIISGLKSDVLYVHYPNILAAIAALIVKFIRPNIKLLVHYHADVIFSSSSLQSVFKFMTGYLLRACDSIIVTSKNYANGSEHLKEFKHKTEVIPLSTSQVKPLNYFKKGHKNNILFVGRLVPYKGIVEFSRHIDGIDPTVNVNIVGDGPLKAQLIDMVGSLKTKSRVSLLGYVHNAELNQLISKANLLVLPSITKAEAFGLVMLEAQAHGVPSVCFNIPGSGVSFANKHNVTGYNAKPFDYDELVYYINHVLEKKPFVKKVLIDHHSKYFSDSAVKRIWLHYMKNIIL